MRAPRPVTSGPYKHLFQKNEFSDIEKINLSWLRNLLLGLSCIYLLYLGDQFFPDLLGMNILGDLITVIAAILIYTMGYLGLRRLSRSLPGIATAPTVCAIASA